VCVCERERKRERERERERERKEGERRFTPRDALLKRDRARLFFSRKKYNGNQAIIGGARCAGHGMLSGKMLSSW
jgi:hypothetical protein